MHVGDDKHREFGVNGGFGVALVSRPFTFKPMRFTRLIILLFLFIQLTSCIEGDEEVWLKKDGSARVEAEYRVPPLLLKEKDAADFVRAIDQGVGSNENLRLVTNRVDKEQGRYVIRIGIEADDITKLRGILPSNGPSEPQTKADKILHAILGSIDVKAQGLSARLRREVNLAPLIDQYVGSNSAILLGNAEFRYVVHLPEAVDESNAHEVSKDGRTLRWRYGLADLKGKPITMSMTAPVPIPWWVYVLLLGVVLLVFLGVVKIVKTIM